MPKISSLEPFLLWREFAAICAEIHPSGHEHALRAKLVKRAREAGLAAAVDAAGNLRIDRPAAPECEKRPAIILQAHLDMVPQADDATGFDFRKTPVTPVIAGDFVTAAGTTLGADNGIGLAAALALIFDPGLRAGPLALLATVEEETSMRGAFLAEPEMLRGDILFNLDSETEGELCCGCAGGCRLTLRLNVPTVPAPPGGRAVKISLSGLKGGHSGMDIDKNRGNAVTMLAGFAARLDAFAVADFRGGSLDNAIPRESAVTGVARQSLAELRKSAGRFAAECRTRFDLPDHFAVTVEAVERPVRVWARQDILPAILAIPDGVIARHAASGAVETSTNLASAAFDGEVLTIRNLPRSCDDAERGRLVKEMKKIWKSFGGRSRVSQPYPGWKPQLDSRTVRNAQKVYRELFGPTPPLRVIHAGVECGIFLEKNPKLELLSFGPTIENPHSPAERVEISSVGRFFDYLQKLIAEV